MIRKKPICIGTGLVALDVILNGSPKTLPKLSVGGSCGNVLSILAFLDWKSLPIARLANNLATKELLTDFNRWNINDKFLKINNEGSTPIIIHRILRDQTDKPIHKFEFRNPERKEWLPHFKPITLYFAKEVIDHNIKADVFYFDRMNPGTVELATYYRNSGALIFFEPSSMKDEKLFTKCLSLAHIVKFSSDRIKHYKERYVTSHADLEIETRGKVGLAYRTVHSTKKQWKTIKPFLIDNIIDTAGAGDWCSAGIIAKLGAGGYTSFKAKKIIEVENALNYGQLLGGLNCTFDGARGLMYHFSKSQLSKFVNKVFENKETDLSSLKVSNQSQIDISKIIQISELY